MLATALSALLAVVLLAVAKDFAKIVRDGIRPFFSPLREVPGPKSSHWFFGNVKEVMRSGPSEMQERWAQEHGPIVKYKAFLNADRLFIMDLRAIGHVLANSHQYAKPGMIRQFMTKILGGEGLIVVEGETHKRQRRVMNPAFGASQIRALGETFMDKALELREVWLQNLHSNQFQAKPGAPESGRVEVVSWFSRATLDIIGLAGFGYDFESLGGTNKDSDELSKAMRALLSPGRQGSFLAILHNIFPATRIIPTKGDLEIKAARKVIQRVGKQFLEDRKLAVRTSNLDNKVERKDFQDRDLLTLLVRANMASDLPESARMTDDEVLAQMSTFLFAGHETTATALSWLIHALSLHPLVQDKLRAELQSCPAGDRPSTDILGNLKYLDAVIRESIRIYSPAPSTLREALEDDIVPTGKEWVDRNGIKRREIPISKGDTIFISMISVNQSKDIWGEDAMEFKPERWLSELPPSAASIPGIWNGSMTFGGGARACIGWRFSLFEMKAVAYTLVRSFRFEQAVPVDDIIKKSTAVMRPYLKDRLEEGPQLPVWVTAIADSSI